MRSILSAFPMETLILHKKSGETQSVMALVDDGIIFSDEELKIEIKTQN